MLHNVAIRNNREINEQIRLGLKKVGTNWQNNQLAPLKHAPRGAPIKKTKVVVRS